MKSVKRQQGFTLADVLIAKREKGKISLLNLSRAREPKEPPSRFMKQCAFTLAEVLITLGIIGVVAAITIPTLMNNIQENQYKTAYKKAFSDASQAFNKAIADGDYYTPLSATTDSISQEANWQIFSSKFSVSKYCNTNNNSQCWDSTGEKLSASQLPNSDADAFIDNSGRAWSMRVSASYGGGFVANFFLVDTNGFKKPNLYGKDRFLFEFYNNSYPAAPQKITNLADWTNDAARCPASTCYYRTWLLK